MMRLVFRGQKIFFLYFKMLIFPKMIESDVSVISVLPAYSLNS